MRALPLAMSVAAWAAACAPRVAPPSESALEIVRRPGGPDLAVIARDTDTVRLSLWLDAGSRDASPPQVATLAAWAAAEAAGAETDAWVTPDALELSTPCRPDDLDGCVARLARAIGVRRIDPAAHERAIARLVAARRAATAADPGRDADRLALDALFGRETAKGLAPFGDAADDGHTTRDAVQAFLADHFGPNRALLVASGRADLGQLKPPVRVAFARRTAAKRQRAIRAARPTEDPIRVSVAEAGAISVAVAATDVAHAAARAHAMQTAMERASDGSTARASAFPIRGGALALVRVDADLDEEQIDRIAVAALGAADEPATETAGDGEVAATDRDDLQSASRRLALAWAAQGGEPMTAGTGLGVLARPDPSSGRGGARAETRLRDAVVTRLREMSHRGAAARTEIARAGSSDAPASMTLGNGARIVSVARPGGRVSIAARFVPGAAADPPLAHGRTAVLAALIARCAGADGASASMHVEPAAWGVSLATPATRWTKALDRLLDCVTSPPLSREAVTAARLDARTAIGPAEAPRALRAAAAHDLSPAHPGEVAAWGSALGVGGTSHAELRAALRDAAVGARLALAIVGKLPVRAALDRAARRLSSLAPGSPAGERPAPAPTSTATSAAPFATGPQRVIVIWRNARAGDPVGARAFATSMRALVDDAPGVEVPWHDGDTTLDFGWAALALAVEAGVLPSLDETLRRAQARLDAATIQHAVDQSWRVHDRRLSDRATGLDDDAERLARRALGLSDPPRSRDGAQALARDLATVVPRWSVLPESNTLTGATPAP